MAATQKPAMAIRVVDSSNRVLESNGSAGSATQKPAMTIRVVNSSNTVLGD